jgi:hypothetical protein
MAMEMPDSLSDCQAISYLVTAPPADVTITSTAATYIDIALTGTNPVTARLPKPSLHALYAASPPGHDAQSFESAQCLYKVVSMGSPDAMEQFSKMEIGTVTDSTGAHPVFIDGWGNPICWLRWAPGFSSQLNPVAPSDIQTGNRLADPDPFDPSRVDVDTSAPPSPRAFHLMPLICSAGPDGAFGLNEFPTSTSVTSRATTLNDVANLFKLNSDNSQNVGGPLNSACFDNITNHHIEQR